MPLYLQVSRAIRDAIESGELRPGQELPSEAQLCEMYGVSRITVRQAVAELLGDALVIRARPRGPLVVTRPRIRRELFEPSGPFVNDILKGGARRRTEVLGATLEPASGRAAAELHVRSGSPLCRVERLHLGDDEPLAYQVSWFPAELVPDLLNRDLSGSLERLCETEYGLLAERKIQRISARSATSVEAEYLGLPRKAPILEIERTLLLAGGRPLEYLIYALVADRFTIVSELRRPVSLPQDPEHR